MYNEYEVTEAEYNKIKQQYLERKINIDRIYHVKELNVMYTFNYTSRSISASVSAWLFAMERPSSPLEA